MGEYLSKTCCNDKSYLLTSDNFSSRLSSPCNSRAIKGLSTPDTDVKAIRHEKNLYEEEISPNFKRSLLRRAFTQAVIAEGSRESGENEELTVVKGFHRNNTFKSKAKTGFIHRFKLKRQEICQQQEKYLRTKENTPSSGSSSTNFRSFCIESLKNTDNYIIRPDGDWDLDIN